MLPMSLRRLMPLVAAAALMPAAVLAEYDILIRNGKVIDGSGNPWFYADVAVKDGKVAAIGSLGDVEAERVLDATNRFVTPGFIDVHTHTDDGIYTEPVAANFIRDGVTTIISGNCGGSMLDVEDYFLKIREQGAAPNVATLYGHNTILRSTKGLIAGELTDEQWVKARELMHKAMKDGAVGMSTGLIYTPGQWSDTEEIIELQKIAGEYGGIYVSHMRSEAADILEAIEEALRIGRETNSRVQISHFKLPTTIAEDIGGSEVTLQKVVDARAAGQEVWIDQYPYTASSTSMNTMLPSWVLEEGPEKAKEILSSSDGREKVIAELTDLHEVQRRRTDLRYAVITTSRAFPDFGSLDIKEATQVRKLMAQQGENVDWRAARNNGQLPDVTMREQYEMVMDIYVNGGAGGVFHSMDEREVENIMRSPLVAICSDSGIRTFGEGHPHPRGYGSNARVLAKYVRERSVITWEEAIRKMTSMPAMAFRFDGRGLLRDGYHADIVIFDPATVTDNATYTDPHNYSTGFDFVIVNGEIVVEKDEVTGKLPGMPIYGPGYVMKEAVASN